MADATTHSSIVQEQSVLHSRSRSPGTVTAFVAPMRAVGTIISRPSLWPLAMVPSVLFGLLVAIGVFAGRGIYSSAGSWVRHALGASALATVGVALAKLIVALLILVMAIVVAQIIVPALAAPFMDSLAAKVDHRTAVDDRLWTQISRSVRVALAGILFVAIPQLVLWLLALAVPHLSPLWIALSIGIGSLGLAHDALDWSLSRRGLGPAQRLAWMRAHPSITTGLGASSWVMSIVPGLSILMLPAMVIAGVSLVNAAEKT